MSSSARHALSNWQRITNSTTLKLSGKIAIRVFTHASKQATPICDCCLDCCEFSSGVRQSIPFGASWNCTTGNNQRHPRVKLGSNPMSDANMGENVSECVTDGTGAFVVPSGWERSASPLHVVASDPTSTVTSRHLIRNHNRGKRVAFFSVTANSTPAVASAGYAMAPNSFWGTTDESEEPSEGLTYLRPVRDVEITLDVFYEEGQETQIAIFDYIQLCEKFNALSIRRHNYFCNAKG
ncbi:hypothetical protein JOM56_008954 [Amanita muscaria]